MTRRTMFAALAAALLAAGCGRDAREIVDEFQFHVSTGNVAGAAKLLDPKVIIIFDGTAYQGRAGAQRWLSEARQKRLAFPVGRLKGERAGWRVSGGRVSGVRLIEGDGYRPDGPGARISVAIEAHVQRGLITRLVYELTPAAKAALGASGDRLKKIAAVFDGPPAAYNLGLFAANAVLEVGATRVTGGPAITGWILRNRPVSSGPSPAIQGSVARWEGTFSHGGGSPRPARIEVDVASATSSAPIIRRYTVVFKDEAASQPAPAGPQPTSQPASQPAPPPTQPAAGSQPGAR